MIALSGVKRRFGAHVVPWGIGGSATGGHRGIGPVIEELVSVSPP